MLWYRFRVIKQKLVHHIWSLLRVWLNKKEAIKTYDCSGYNTRLCLSLSIWLVSVLRLLRTLQARAPWRCHNQSMVHVNPHTILVHPARFGLWIMLSSRMSIHLKCHQRAWKAGGLTLRSVGYSWPSSGFLNLPSFVQSWSLWRFGVEMSKRRPGRPFGWNLYLPPSIKPAPTLGSNGQVRRKLRLFLPPHGAFRSDINDAPKDTIFGWSLSNRGRTAKARRLARCILVVS